VRLSWYSVCQTTGHHLLFGPSPLPPLTTKETKSISESGDLKYQPYITELGWDKAFPAYSVSAVLGTPSLCGTVASLSSNPHLLASNLA